jgi:hypothetical protein
MYTRSIGLPPELGQPVLQEQAQVPALFCLATESEHLHR